MQASTFAYAIVAGLVPSLIWIFFWLREDAEHSEPRWLLASAFMGGVFAVLAAVIAEKYISINVTDQTWRYTLWAVVEEVFKFIAVASIALHTKFNDEPIDAMIYCIMTALGFAAIENALFAIQPYTESGLAQSINTVNMRFIGATLVHTVSSALIGFSFGLVFYKSTLKKIFAVIIGMIPAIALHASFNLSIINGNGEQTMKTFLWVWISVVMIIILFEEIKSVHPKLEY